MRGARGWAEAFARREFGGFIGPVRAIDDKVAQTFMQELLEAIIAKHQPIGRALAELRQRHYREAPGCLFYSYYGNPLAIYR